MKKNVQDALIRNERPEDEREVEELTRRAFWNLHHPGCDEHYFVHTMRTHPDFIPELDFVMEKDGRMIGNIMYLRAGLMDADGARKEIVSFGPVSILPEYQRQGYGRALMEHSFKMAADMGYEDIAIFGHPCNYIPLGFVSCKKLGVHMGNGTYPTALLVKELKPGALSGGDWTYQESEACDIDPLEAEKFDAQFPPAKKEYRQSQEEFYIYSNSRLV